MLSIQALTKILYVRFMKGLRVFCRPLGLLDFLEARRHNRFFLWLRSLFAIYDFADLRSIDLPWWNLQAASEIEAYLKNRKAPRVFEYGSGASTCWLAKRAFAVTSVEHDIDWVQLVQIATSSMEHVRVLAIPPEQLGRGGEIKSNKPEFSGYDFQNYVQAIEKIDGDFDLIVIDGRCRSACLQRALAKLAPGGMIVFDNSGRARYQAAIENSGLVAKRYRGLTACLPYPDETTLLH